MLIRGGRQGPFCPECGWLLHGFLGVTKKQSRSLARLSLVSRKQVLSNQGRIFGLCGEYYGQSTSGAAADDDGQADGENEPFFGRVTQTKARPREPT